MKHNKTPKTKAAAMESLARLQASARYRSFFTASTLEAFAKLEGSTLAGATLEKPTPAQAS